MSPCCRGRRRCANSAPRSAAGSDFVSLNANEPRTARLVSFHSSDQRRRQQRRRQRPSARVAVFFLSDEAIGLRRRHRWRVFIEGTQQERGKRGLFGRVLSHVLLPLGVHHHNISNARANPVRGERCSRQPWRPATNSHAVTSTKGLHTPLQHSTPQGPHTNASQQSPPRFAIRCFDSDSGAGDRPRERLRRRTTPRRPRRSDTSTTQLALVGCAGGGAHRRDGPRGPVRQRSAAATATASASRR